MRLGAVLALAVAAGFIAWLVLRDTGHSPTTTTTAATTTTTTAAVPTAFAITPANLSRLAASIQQPIFWLGRKAGDTYELTRGQAGKIYVRYLPSGVAIGSGKPYLTVATYPFPGAYAALQKQAAVKGAVTAKLSGGGIAVLDSGYPESVHVAYPNVDYQVEVYDPTPAHAMQLVSSGKLAILGDLHASGTGRAGAPVAASVGDLKALAARLGHPIYWAGTKPGYTYELTQTPSGRVFIRYLPPGTKVGDPRAGFLTVATYPFPGAYAAVAKTAEGGARIGLAHGGMAAVDTLLPEEHPPRLPGSELPGRGLRSLSQHRPQARRLRARSDRSRSPGRPGRRSWCSPGSSFRSSSACSRSAAGCSSSNWPGSCFPALCSSRSGSLSSSSRPTSRR